MDVLDSVVIGAGPGGINAAINLEKAGLSFRLFECDTPGGKVNLAPEVDNFPGYRNISGPKLAMEFYKKAIEAGVEINYEEALDLTKEGDIFKLVTSRSEYLTRTVIIATGTHNNLIGLEHEQEFLGHGISYCSICDGHFFKGLDVMVIGGGNVALKESIHLSTLVGHLYLIHRRNEFRGNPLLVEDLRKKSNVEILTPYICTKILGEDEVTGVIIENVETHEEREIRLDGLFPLVGQIPNTQFVHIDGVLNSGGTIPVDKNRESPVHNIFAIGDVTERLTRQIFIAYKDGEIAAKVIAERLNK